MLRLTYEMVRLTYQMLRLTYAMLRLTYATCLRLVFFILGPKIRNSAIIMIPQLSRNVNKIHNSAILHITRPSSIIMEATPRGRLPEELLTMILTGIPLKTLPRFKCVSKPWKALIESPYFRRLFVSLHMGLSTWSLMVPNAHLEFGFHGCELWNISNSTGSFLTPDPTNLPTFYRASSNGLVLGEIGRDSLKSFVGNPGLQNWVEIPHPPQPCKFTALVTPVEEHGQASRFKVVRTCETSASDSNEWRVCVYSSDSGVWSQKRLVPSLDSEIIYLWP